MRFYIYLFCVKSRFHYANKHGYMILEYTYTSYNQEKKHY
jgi:hypothetical protein